jgi:hypothetical protein
LKGEISGIRSFLRLPEVLIESTEAMKKSQENANDNTSNSSESDNAGDSGSE